MVRGDGHLAPVGIGDPDRPDRIRAAVGEGPRNARRRGKVDRTRVRLERLDRLPKAIVQNKHVLVAAVSAAGGRGRIDVILDQLDAPPGIVERGVVLLAGRIDLLERFTNLAWNRTKHCLDQVGCRLHP